MKESKKYRKEIRREVRKNYSLHFKDKAWYIPNFVWNFLLKLVIKEKYKIFEDV